MGQAQSDEYQCDGRTEDVADSEINSSDPPDKTILKYNDLKNQDTKCSTNVTSKVKEQHQHFRKLSNVSHRNIQLLSMRPRSEKESYADDLRTRRRSSLINLILGAPSSGPRFSDDLCSLSSHMSECNFGIEFFPDTYNAATSITSFRLESIEDIERIGESLKVREPEIDQKRRRSSLGSLAANIGLTSVDPSGTGTQRDKKVAPSELGYQGKQQFRKPSLASTLASIDLISSFEQHDKSGPILSGQYYRPPLCKTKQTIYESVSEKSANDLKTRASKGRVNQSGRVLRRAESEFSLYSNVSATSGAQSQRSSVSTFKQPGKNLNETKLIIILQVCLPFVLAGFGNMAAGLVLNRVAQWRAFHHVPTFFVLLPPLVGLKGNIEMTLASRLSTLSNLNLLNTNHQRKRAYVSNLILILSQAIGLSIFAAFISILCEFFMVGSQPSDTDIVRLLEMAILVVLASALATSILLVMISSIMMSLAIALANLIQVNPDNLSTLMAALYGDVSCVLVYGLIADWMFSLKEQNILTWPLIIIISTFVTWPILLFAAYKFKETRSIALSSMPPMFMSIIVSMGSGAVLSLVVGRFKLIALYQPVVNGFGANLIAVQASRVSTWLWCSALRRISITKTENIETPKKILGSLASFTVPGVVASESDKKFPRSGLPELMVKFVKTILWSFCNSSPNSIAARLLLIMMIPAHTIYFFVIWLLSPANYVVMTWQFYSIYIALCVIQVFILLAVCEPLMTLLMHRKLDPDVFGISILMAMADLTGTLCLAGAFFFLANIGDINAE